MHASAPRQDPAATTADAGPEQRPAGASDGSRAGPRKGSAGPIPTLTVRTKVQRTTADAYVDRTDELTANRVAARRERDRRRAPRKARQGSTARRAAARSTLVDRAALAALHVNIRRPLVRRTDNVQWQILSGVGHAWVQPLDADDDRILVAGVDLLAAGVTSAAALRRLRYAAEAAGHADAVGCASWGRRRISGVPSEAYVKAITLGVGICHKVRGKGDDLPGEGGRTEGGERTEKYSWALWHPELEAPLVAVLDDLSAVLAVLSPAHHAAQVALFAAGPQGAAARGRALGALMVRWRDEASRPSGVDAAGTSGHVDDFDHPDALAAVLTLHLDDEGGPVLPAKLCLPRHRVEVPLTHGSVVLMPARLVEHAVSGFVEGRRVAFVAYLSEYMTPLRPQVEWWHHGEGHGPCPCGCVTRGFRQDASARCPCGCGRALEGKGEGGV